MPYTEIAPKDFEIVGSAAWARLSGENAEFVNRSKVYNACTTRRSKKQTRKQKATQSEILRNMKKIDEIINFTYANGWQQIEGGRHNNKWINSSKYNDKLFASGKILELGTNETHYFPIGDTFDDIEGIAFNYRLNHSSNTYDIIPNKWQTSLDTRKGRRRQKRIKKMKERRALKQELKN